MAKQFAEELERECAPFQCALTTRVGTVCVGHMLRAACDADGSGTVLSVDGIGEYDHILRSVMLERLRRMPKARTILPFVRGMRMVSIGIQGALEEVAGTLEADEQLCAFSDDTRGRGMAA